MITAIEPLRTTRLNFGTEEHLCGNLCPGAYSDWLYNNRDWRA
jgi:hypothetical protein